MTPTRPQPLRGKYYPTIGLEIHAQLATQTKMFSRAQNVSDPATPPNTHIDPVSMAHPGTLPVVNKKAIEHMIRIGLSVGGTISNFTEFDRKNYFYPDIPKGYQISQYKYPIVSGGALAGVDITRIHLEEDTGTNKHADGYSLVDFNRAGVPLMELVTEPVIYDAETAVSFAKELQQLLRYLGVAHANMERGEMRVEANISISTDPNTFGTKVEVKNMGSFNMVGRAIAYELDRMIQLHEAGKAGDIVQETRGWNDDKQKTFSQRIKEDSADYRYFPEPDIPKMYLHELFDLDAIKQELPELPWEKRARYTHDFGIKSEDIEIYIANMALGSFFENAIIPFAGDTKKITLASNYITSDLVGIMAENEEALSRITPDAFSELITMATDGDINSRGAKDILAIMATDGGNPRDIAKARGLIQENDPEALRLTVTQIVAEHPEQTAEYKNGKEVLIKFFVGQGMKATKGAGNPKILEDLFVEILKK